MLLNETALFDDIVSLIQSRANTSDTRFKYTLTVIAPDRNLEMTKVWEVKITRDFVNRYSDYITLVVSTSRLYYDDVIFPNRKNLFGQLTVEALNDKSGVASNNKATEKFRLKLVNLEDENLKYSDALAKDPKEKIHDLKNFAVQLINLDIEQMRLKDISGVVRDTTTEDLLSVVVGTCVTPKEAYPELFTGEAIEEYDGRPVDLHTPDRTTKLDQVVIPDGLTVSELPAWVQKFGGGVYEYNLGFYCYREWAYIYPLYNLNAVSGRRKIEIYSVSPMEFLGVDNTYIIKNSVISILSTGEVTNVDESEINEFNRGNGVRFSLPSFNLKESLTHDNGNTNFNNIYSIHGDNKDGLNNTVVHNRITANSFYEVSRIAQNRGIRASFKWDNANSTLILPNTEVKVLYKTASEVVERHGVVIGMDYISSMLENDANDSHKGEALIHCFLG